MSLRIGLIGGGPWAKEAIVPALAEHPKVHLSSIWIRDEEKKAALAAEWDVVGAASIEAICETVDGVIFGVPPEVQPELAGRVAATGTPIWLEKPLGVNSASIEQLHSEVSRYATPTFFHLPYRESTAVQELAVWAQESGVLHLRVTFYSGALLRDGEQNAGWRSNHPHGALLDLGPHCIGMAEDVGGQILQLSAHRTGIGWDLHCIHASCTSTISLSGVVAVDPSITSIEACAGNERGHGNGYRFADARSTPRDIRLARSLDRFVSIMNGEHDPTCSIEYGVHVQHLLDRAIQSRGEER